MNLITQLEIFFNYLIAALIIAVIVLMLLRLIVIYADVNPFSKFALAVRSWSDPVVNPVRSRLMGFGFNPKYAPLVTILITILVGYFTLKLVGNVLLTIRLIIASVIYHSPISLVGSILYGFLAILNLLIIVRIIFSWGASERNRVMLFLVRATEPVLGPFRRIIPPLGTFDISPIVALLLLQL